MADLYLTLVTGSSVTLADLGNYVIPAGTTDMPTSQIADDSELAESTSWSSSLAAGEFTLTDLSGDPVTEVVAIGNTSNTFYGTQTYIGPVTGSLELLVHLVHNTIMMKTYQNKQQHQSHM